MMVEKLFEENFLKKIKKSKFVGVEIEMPLINCKKPYRVQKDIIQELFKDLLNMDFVVSKCDNDNNIIALKNIKNCDVISMEYSWNTLEISLNKENNIYKLIYKFNKYYNYINKFLKKYNYKLCDDGINPNYKKINRECLNEERYKIIQKLLIQEDNKLFSQFCSYCCSIQTHINVDLVNVCKLFNLFTLISSNKEEMFSNSYIDETGLNNSRKYLWNISNFGPSNVGKNKIYNDINEIKYDYLNRTLFFVQRGNDFYLLKNKCSLRDYYENRVNEIILDDGSIKKVKPLKKDFNNFRSYKEVELTRHGTLEIRTDCTQSLDRIFKVVAFNVGISLCADEIIKHIEKNKGIDNKKLIEFAIKGLKIRGNNEESLLEEKNL